MSDERILELVSAATDGELDDDEHVELDRLLHESPEARQFQSDLGRIESILRKLPELDPPPTLHSRVLGAVSPPAARKRPVSGWLRSPATFTVLRYGMATVAGAVLAAVLIESQPRFGDKADTSELVGTIAPDRDRTAAQVVDSHAFRAGGLESQVFLERRNGALLLDIRVDADEPVDIAVHFAAAGARLDALAQDEDAPELIEIAGQTLRVRARGRRQLTALLHRVDDAASEGPEKIELEFSSDGKLLQRGSLTPAW